MSTILTCTLDLPHGYRAGDILEFHRRDAEEIAERVTASELRKGLQWDGVPACLVVSFTPRRAQVELQVDGPAAGGDEGRLQQLARRMLGLTQDIETFEARFALHPVLGPLLASQAGLRVPVSPTPFEALSWAITGQQISVSAAVSCRRRLILAAGSPHSSGLRCYPEAAQVARLSFDDLRAAGFSNAKAATLQCVAAQAASGELPFEAWLESPPVETIESTLRAMRGIGPWTVNYALLRGFAALDGSLHGDVAVRKGVQRLLGLAERPDERWTAQWLAQFSPWRALVAAHLWASLAMAA